MRFVPEYRFDTFDCVTPEFLESIGIKGIVLDIDNTLEPYEHPDPGEHVLAWFDSLYRVGIKTSIVSNNNKDRVDRFNKNLKMPAYFKAGKPFKKKILFAISDMGTDKSNTILMGDQVFTDVLGAHNAGIKAILVSPINDKRDPLTRFKRMLEKPILSKFERNNKGDGK